MALGSRALCGKRPRHRSVVRGQLGRGAAQPWRRGRIMRSPRARASKALAEFSGSITRRTLTLAAALAASTSPTPSPEPRHVFNAPAEPRRPRQPKSPHAACAHRGSRHTAGWPWIGPCLYMSGVGHGQISRQRHTSPPIICASTFRKAPNPDGDASMAIIIFCAWPAHFEGKPGARSRPCFYGNEARKRKVN